MLWLPREAVFGCLKLLFGVGLIGVVSVVVLLEWACRVYCFCALVG